MIRTIIDILLVIFFFFVTIPILIIFWIIGLFSPKLRDYLSISLMKIAFSIILFSSGVKVKVEGLDNIPKDRAVLYVGNHRSYFDIIIAYKNIVGPTGFMSKCEFKKVPVLGHWITFLHGLYIDRKDIRQGLQAILTAAENTKKGISYFIFPEGTRNHEKEMLKFHEGSLKIATKGGCPIIPVAIKHADEIFEVHFPLIKATKVSIRYGEPIYTDSLSRDELKFIGAKTRDIIQAMLDEME